LFDPYSVDELCYAIANVVDDVAFRNQLIAEGTKQVKKFSWDRTIQETLEVYAALGK
jgi:glycosyltransferase involved in cell wall biosynthesis